MNNQQLTAWAIFVRETAKLYRDSSSPNPVELTWLENQLRGAFADPAPTPVPELYEKLRLKVAELQAYVNCEVPFGCDVNTILYKIRELTAVEPTGSPVCDTVKAISARNRLRRVCVDIVDRKYGPISGEVRKALINVLQETTP